MKSRAPLDIVMCVLSLHRQQAGRIFVGCGEDEIQTPE